MQITENVSKFIVYCKIVDTASRPIVMFRVTLFYFFNIEVE